MLRKPETKKGPSNEHLVETASYKNKIVEPKVIKTYILPLERYFGL